MSTAPYDPQVAALVTGPHAVAVTVSATSSYAGSFATIADLDVVRGTVDWSERRSPRVAARLTVRCPGQPILDQLDPRLGVRVLVSPGYRLPSGAWDYAQAGNLQLRSKTVNRPDNTLDLIATSDEATMIEQRFLDQPGSPDITVDARDYLTALIPALYPLGDPPTISWRAGTASVSWPDSVGDVWSKIVDVADALDVDVYDNGDRVIVFAPRPYRASVAAASLAVGANGTLLRSAAELDRDDWANWTGILYRPVDNARNDFVLGGARVIAGPFDVETVGYVTYTENRPGLPSQAQADKAAAALLRRMLSRTRTLTLDAVSMWWLRPGHTVTVQLPAGPPERVLVSSVSHDLAASRMTLVTRTPDDVSTIKIGT